MTTVQANGLTPDFNRRKEELEGFPLDTLRMVGTLEQDNSTWFLSGCLAFGVLSVAGVYAIFIALIDHMLRSHSPNKLVQTLPALDTLEGFLFSLIKVGLVVLTVSLVTGLIYVDDLFGQHLAHKTILSIFAWLVFAVLLWGRWKRGWRGRVAVRMTLVGIALLLLSYFGSKLVLEIILERSWHIQG